ncbi:MAG TPA: hypothetical protein DEF89_00635 [Desulfosporosinus sp.]|nr:hypothetical protein [Desulfosporosinus sp.]
MGKNGFLITYRHNTKVVIKDDFIFLRRAKRDHNCIYSCNRHKYHVCGHATSFSLKGGSWIMKTYETIMIAIGSCTLLVSLLVLIVEVVKVIAR